MQTQDIDIFLSVIETGSISRTADEKYMTYQGIRLAISRLEELTGEKLFSKDGPRYVLTEFGEYFRQQFAEPIAHYSSEISRSREYFGKYKSQNLKIALPVMPSDYRNDDIRKLCEEFREDHPGTKCEFVYGNASENEQALVDGDVDIAVCLNDLDGYTCRNAFKCEYYLSVYKTHPLYGRASLDGADLSQTLVVAASRNLNVFKSDLFRQTGLSADYLVIASPANPLNRTYEDLYYEGKVAYLDFDSSVSPAWPRVNDPSASRRLEFVPAVAFYNRFVYRDHAAQKEIVYKIVDFLSERL